MKSILTIIALFACTLSIAQPVKKVYAYSQHFTRGMVRERDMDDERSGKPAQQEKLIQYFIYIALHGKDSLLIDKIRIGGTWYAVLRTAFVTTPVIIDQPVKRTLVPASPLHILQVQIGEALPRQNLVLPKTLAMSELVIPYIYNSRMYSAAQKKITVLQPVSGL